MRLIDADALKQRAIRVSTVKERCYMKAVGTHEIDKAPTVDPVRHAAGSWIPVSERLPEPYIPVLTCRQEANSGWRYICMDKVIFQNGNEDEPVWIGDIRWTASTITHWMSLPECPWGEEKNKYEL